VCVTLFDWGFLLRSSPGQNVPSGEAPFPQQCLTKHVCVTEQVSKDLSYFFVGNLVGIITASKAASNLEALLPDGVTEAPLLSDHSPVHIPTAYVLLNGGMG